MRFFGSRRALGIILVLIAVLAIVLWRASRLYAEAALRSVGPTVVAQLEERLQRKITVERLVWNRPGLLLAEGVHVSRGKTADSGTLLSLDRLELRYNAGLLSWASLQTRGFGQETRASVRASGITLHGPNPLPLVTSPRPLFVSERVAADFDLAPALRGSADLVPTIRRVELHKPRFAAVRRRDGTWDLEQHLKGEDTGFRGEVVATAVLIDLTNHAAGSLAGAQRQQISGDVTLQFAGGSTMRFSASGQTLGPESATFRAAGTRDGKSRRWFASIEAETPRMAYWYRYFVKEPKGTEVLAGGARVSGAVWDDHPKPGSEPEFRLDLDISGGAARIKGVPPSFSDFSGRISTQKDLLSLAGTARLGSLPLRISGNVLVGQPGHATWSLSSQRVDATALTKTFPDLKLPEGLRFGQPLSFQALLTGGADDAWSAKGEVQARDIRYQEMRSPQARITFQGRFGEGLEPEVTGGFQLPRFQREELALSDLGGRFTWKQGLVEAAGRFGALGGSGALRGWARVPSEGTPELYLTGQLSDVQLQSLPWKAEGLELTGVGSAEFVLSGSQDAPRISAFVRGTGLTVNDHQVEEVAARVRFEDERLLIEEGTLRDRKGAAAVTGTIGKEQELDLQIETQDLKLAALLDPEMQVFGTATIRGRLTGTPQNPTATGEIKLYQPRYRALAGDFASASFSATDKFVQVFELKLIRAPETVTADRLELSREGERSPWTVRGDFEVHGLSLGRAVALAGVDQKQRQEWPVAGEVERLHLSASGPVDAPVLDFSAAVGSGSLRRIDLGRLEVAGRLDSTGRKLQLHSFLARSPLGTVTAAGTLDLPMPGEPFLEHTRARLQFRAAGLPLARLISEYQPRARQYARIRGTADLAGEVSGRLAEPTLQLERVQVADLAVNGTAIALEPLRVRVHPDGVIVRNLRAQMGEGELTLDYVAVGLGGGTEQKPRVVLGPLTARSLPVPLLLELAESSPALEEPERDWLEVFDRWAQRSGVLNATLATSGGARPDDAEILAQLARTGSAPSAAGELRIEGLQLADGLGAPASVSVRLNQEPGRLEVARFAVSQPGGLEITAVGRTEGKIPETARLAYSVKVAGLDLDLLEQVPDRELRSRLVAVQPLKGILSAAAEISGTHRQPAVRFSVQVKDPVVAGIPLDRASLENAVYSATQNRLSIGSAVLAKRPSPGAPEASLRASGHLPVSWPDLAVPGNLERDITVEFPRQPLSVLNALASDADRVAKQLNYELPAGRERFTRLFGQILAPEGAIEGRVRLAGTADVPNNSGSLSVASESVRLRGMGPAVPGEGWHLPGWLAQEIAAAEPLQTAIDGFRLRVELAGNVVRVAELSGKSSHGGGFTGGGEVTLGRDLNGGPAARLNLRFSADGFRIAEKEAARALGPAYQGTQLRTTLTTVSPVPGGGRQPLRITGDWPRVLVSGGVRIDDANLPLALDTPAGESSTPLPENVQLNLVVLPGEDVWLRNALVRLQLERPAENAGGPRTEGALVITNQLSAPVVQGTLRASHGVFNLPLIRLRNGEGVIRVAYDGRTADFSVQQPAPIYLDLSAETTLRIQRSPVVEAEYYDATFEIRGSPGAGGAAGIRATGINTGLAIGAEGGLTVTVRTDPPLPSGQIEALIRQQYVAEGFGPNGANVVETLRGQIEQAFAVNVASEFTGQLEDKVRTALGLSIFSVDFGVSQPLRVRLGKRLFGPIYGTITQSFGGADDQVERRYEIYYRVSPQFRIGYREEDPLNRKVFFFSGTASF